MLKKVTSVVLIISIVFSICVIPSSAAISTNQSIEAYIKAHLRTFEPDVDVTHYVNNRNMSMEDIMNSYIELVYNDMELFYVNIKSRVLRVGTKYFITEINYICTRSELATKQREMRNAAAKAYEQINNSMSEPEKILALNEYMILTVAYNDTIVNNPNGYGALVERGATCQGYARGLQYLLSYGKFENRIVREINERMNHSWNIVKIGSDWYHVDTTKDDPITNRIDNFGRVAHRFVLASDTQLPKTDNRRWDRAFYPRATNTQFDAVPFRASVRSPLIKFGDYWYYIQKDPKSPSNNKNIKNNHKDYAKTYNDIIQYDFKTGETKKIHTYEGTWFRWGTENNRTKQWFPDSFGSLQHYNGLMYYNSNNSIFSFDPHTKKETKVADKPRNARGYIYGIFIEGNVLTYTIRERVGTKDTLHTIELPRAASTAIKLSRPSISGRAGRTATVTAQLAGSRRDYIYWASADTTIATVDKGKISFKAKGQTTITAYTSTGKQATMTVRVS
ncbi:MAG: Ig-like domain-containing protein [Oscillospiraceae bacterium]|nr:Ig-like domain-containing protein [Oscillospiraceae bacterium]